jgi:hypothetical protein
MFGIRFIKSQPTVHLMQFKNGNVVREGVGDAFFYYAPTSTLVAVPIGSQAQPFMFELVTSDFQKVTIQGEAAWRIAEPRRIANLLDFSLKPGGSAYTSEDPSRLGERVVAQVQVAVQQQLQSLNLQAALRAAADVAQSVRALLVELPELCTLGIEVISVAVWAIKPTPDIARALEAEAREANLKAADDAVYLRRMASVEKERAIRENELETEVAVELKQRQIQDARMQARAELMRSENLQRDEQMSADVALETKRTSLVDEQARNNRTLAEAEAYRVAAVMQAFDNIDPRIVQALAAGGMQPSQLIAQAFGDLAGKAERIGQLNISPDLLQSLMQPARKTAARQGAAS